MQFPCHSPIIIIFLLFPSHCFLRKHVQLSFLTSNLVSQSGLLSTITESPGDLWKLNIPGPHLDLQNQESPESESRKGHFKPASLDFKAYWSWEVVLYGKSTPSNRICLFPSYILSQRDSKSRKILITLKIQSCHMVPVWRWAARRTSVPGSETTPYKTLWYLFLSHGLNLPPYF